MRLSTIIIVFFMALGLAILCGLGWWQVERLYWKEALIERVTERLASDPVPIPTLQEAGFDKDSQEYKPVAAQGTYDHAGEVYFFATNKRGGSGWNVHTPLIMENGEVLIVNRGFVPFPMQAPEKRIEGQITGPQTVTGLLRFPLTEKPGSSFENSIEKREFYWRNVAEMSQAIMPNISGKTQEDFLPVILDADKTPNPGGFPKGDTTIIKFTNSHLQYAGTWFGLALTLLIVGSYFLYTRREKGI